MLTNRFGVEGVVRGPFDDQGARVITGDEKISVHGTRRDISQQHEQRNPLRISLPIIRRMAAATRGTRCASDQSPEEKPRLCGCKSAATDAEGTN